MVLIKLQIPWSLVDGTPGTPHEISTHTFRQTFVGQCGTRSKETARCGLGSWAQPHLNPILINPLVCPFNLYKPVQCFFACGLVWVLKENIATNTSQRFGDSLRPSLFSTIFLCFFDFLHNIIWFSWLLLIKLIILKNLYWIWDDLTGNAAEPGTTREFAPCCREPAVRAGSAGSCWGCKARPKRVCTASSSSELVSKFPSNFLRTLAILMLVQDILCPDSVYRYVLICTDT